MPALTALKIVLPEKPIVAHLVKKFLAFYGTRRIISMLTRNPALDPILSRMKLVPTLTSILILATLRFSNYNFERIFHLPVRATCPPRRPP
jgi:hypothetical protein